MNVSALEEMVRYNIQHSLEEANVQNANEAYDGAAGSASAHSDEAEAQPVRSVTGRRRASSEQPAEIDLVAVCAVNRCGLGSPGMLAPQRGSGGCMKM